MGGTIQLGVMAPRTFWNQTTARRDARVDTAFLVFNCAVLTSTFILGLLGNVLVCWVVYRTKSLQTSNNALLVSLAASDLLKCCVDAPLLLFSVLRYGKDGRASVSLCGLQQFSYALCSCVQLLTLVGISVERFQAIAFPFQTERRKARIRVWILSIWACGLALAVISLTLSKRALFYMLCRRQIWSRSEEHPQYTDPFGAYVLVPVWGCSLTLIVIHYMRIFKVVRQQRKKVFDSGIQLRPTMARHVWSCVTAPAPRTAPPRSSLGSLPTTRSFSSPRGPGRTVITVAEVSASRVDSSPGRAPGRPPEIVGAVCLLTPCARERGKKRMEGKLAQRFGYIIIVFTLFWMPMVVALLVNIISWQETNSLLMELETSAMVLTCVPAAVDPLIYTMVTRQFRNEFSKILSSFPGCPLKPKGQRLPGADPH